MKPQWIAQVVRITLSALVGLAISVTAQAQKSAVGRYETKETSDKAFLAALHAIPSVKFAVKSSEKEQGTIQATRNASGREYASLFVIVRKEQEEVILEATFTRNPGFMGGGSPEEWANKFGEALKADLPDLRFTVNKK